MTRSVGSELEVLTLNTGTLLSLCSRAAAAAAKLLQLCPTLCDPIDSSPPSSAVPGILQARTLEWVAISFSNAWKWKVKVKLLSRVWLSNPMDYSLPGSSVHGIFQARVLEWGAIAFSALELECFSYWAHKLNYQSPSALEPVCCNKRSHHHVKPAYCN